MPSALRSVRAKTSAQARAPHWRYDAEQSDDKGKMQQQFASYPDGNVRRMMKRSRRGAPASALLSCRARSTTGKRVTKWPAPAPGISVRCARANAVAVTKAGNAGCGRWRYVPRFPAYPTATGSTVREMAALSQGLWCARHASMMIESTNAGRSLAGDCFVFQIICLFRHSSENFYQ